MSVSLRVLALIALVVLLAGCGALESGDDREPYGVDDPVEPTDDELLPGLTEEGVTDEYRLYGEHRSALEDEPYRSEWNRTIRTENGTILESAEQTRDVSADRDLARVRHVTEDETGTQLEDVWFTDGTAYIRWIDDEPEPNYAEDPALSSVSSLDPSDPYPPQFLALEKLYAAVETVSVEDGGERYRLEATPDEFGPDENASVTLLVDESGYLTEYTYVAERSTGDDQRLIEERFDLESELDRPLEEPEWLEDARAAAENDTDA